MQRLAKLMSKTVDTPPHEDDYCTITPVVSEEEEKETFEPIPTVVQRKKNTPNLRVGLSRVSPLPLVRVASDLQSMNISNAFGSHPPPFPGEITVTGGGGDDFHADQPCIQWYTSTGQTTTFPSTGIFLFPVGTGKVTFGPVPSGTLSVDNSTGVITYLGSETRTFQILANIVCGSLVVPPTGIIQFWITKNGNTTNPQSSSPYLAIQPQASSTYTSNSLFNMMTLAKGDTVGLACYASGSDTWNFINLSMQVIATLN